MAAADGDLYLVYLPAQPPGTTIHYYIHAEDTSGRSGNHPPMGAAEAPP